MLSIFIFFSSIIRIISDNVLGNKYKWRNLIDEESNESLFIERCFFFPLNCFSRITFRRNLAQIFRSDRPTYVWNRYFHSFYTSEVMAHFVVEEISLNEYLATLYKYNSWDLNSVAFFSTERF